MRFAVVILFSLVSLTCATDDPTKDCGEGAKWYTVDDCRPCDRYCDGQPESCLAVCQAGCFCLPGYRRVDDRFCKPEDCC